MANKGAQCQDIGPALNLVVSKTHLAESSRDRKTEDQDRLPASEAIRNGRNAMLQRSPVTIHANCLGQSRGQIFYSRFRVKSRDCFVASHSPLPALSSVSMQLAIFQQISDSAWDLLFYFNVDSNQYKQSRTFTSTPVTPDAEG